jgi:hypothetical protein
MHLLVLPLLMLPTPLTPGPPCRSPAAAGPQLSARPRVAGSAGLAGADACGQLPSLFLIRSSLSSLSIRRFFRNYGWLTTQADTRAGRKPSLAAKSEPRQPVAKRVASTTTCDVPSASPAPASPAAAAPLAALPSVEQPTARALPPGSPAVPSEPAPEALEAAAALLSEDPALRAATPTPQRLWRGTSTFWSACLPGLWVIGLGKAATQDSGPSLFIISFFCNARYGDKVCIFIISFFCATSSCVLGGPYLHAS